MFFRHACNTFRRNYVRSAAVAAVTAGGTAYAAPNDFSFSNKYKFPLFDPLVAKMECMNCPSKKDDESSSEEAEALKTPNKIPIAAAKPTGPPSFLPMEARMRTKTACKNCPPPEKEVSNTTPPASYGENGRIELGSPQFFGPVLTQAETTECQPSRDPQIYSDTPDYIPEHKREELGSALSRQTEVSAESRSLLRLESSFPVERAVMTAPPHVPPPISRNHPVHLVADIGCVSKRMRVAGSTKYEYWPFGFWDDRERKWVYTVPGPFIRARVGDILQVNFINQDESGMAHSIDFHSVIGPGGGSPTNFAEQDETKTGAYMLTKPGLYVYHCAAAPIPVHINNGMFGLILVEPTEPLPPVDKEFYVMQSELYAEDSEDEDNFYENDYEAASNEIPKHVFFNGREGSLVEKPIMVNQDDRVRLYVGNGGPNLVSSFHVIGAIFDKVYREGDLVSPPARHVQTTLIPAGGATVVDMDMMVPGSYAIVDHSINRIDKGAVGMIKVKGKPRPDLYDSMEAPAYCPGCKTHQ